MKSLCTFLVLAILLSLPGVSAIAQDLKDVERVTVEVDTSTEEQLNHDLIYTNVGDEMITGISKKENKLIFELSNGSSVSFDKPTSSGVTGTLVDSDGREILFTCLIPADGDINGVECDDLRQSVIDPGVQSRFVVNLITGYVLIQTVIVFYRMYNHL